MQQFRLIPHATTPCEFVRSVVVDVARTSAGELAFVYVVDGDIARLKVPPPRAPARADELWRETCFEAFLRSDGSTSYSEFNFAPSGAWAAYQFADYRRGMHAIEPMQPPTILCRPSEGLLQVDVRLNVPLVAEKDLRAALAAVLRDNEERISYWALAHAPGRPDFHQSDGFTATLER